MGRKNEVQEQDFGARIDDWYTISDATKVLSRNHKRKISPAYTHQLVTLHKIRAKKLSPRVTLFYKADVDAYRIEPRGSRSGAAKRERYGIAPDQPTVRELRRQAKEKQAKPGESEQKFETLA